MRDDWTSYRFVIYDSRVAFDITTLLAPTLRDFLLLTPHHARFWTEPEVQFHVFRRQKREEKKKKRFRKKSFQVDPI